MKRLTGVLAIALAMSLSATVGAGLAAAQKAKKKLKRCKDGEVTKVVDVKYAEGENLPFTIKASMVPNT